ncbi:hypothetical protein IM697_33740 [Streptomyces ferrugineus]|uniref:6-phosphogluconate dehydrogenase C-terminal domain-containing protein n=1 Tax=Streptomyces ferrugineus TaxID=1413221 RepID=A0A7M2T1E0_9ACTN|nr:hypothetical protein [Streptomyces ferrugineus]QOV41588.1 hypothetical protein IM697_33740 [Streptomyces ferrugineus]
MPPRRPGGRAAARRPPPAARRSIPVPAFSAAFTHYDTLRTGHPGTFHTHWSHPDRPESTT